MVAMVYRKSGNVMGINYIKYNPTAIYNYKPTMIAPAYRMILTTALPKEALSSI